MVTKEKLSILQSFSYAARRSTSPLTSSSFLWLQAPATNDTDTPVSKAPGVFVILIAYTAMILHSTVGISHQRTVWHCFLEKKGRRQILLFVR